MKLSTPPKQEMTLLTTVTVIYFVAILLFAYMYVQA
jgi:hypothetical protein